MAQIEIKNLTFRYTDAKTGEYLEERALDDVCLDIEQGEFVVVCGKTGCGKSTLLRNLKPSIRPKGEITGELFYNIGNCFAIPYIIKSSARIAEARKGSYSYESAPRERVRKRTLCSEQCPVDELKDRDVAEKIGFVMQNPEHQIVTDSVWHELAFGLESLGYPSEEIRLRTAEIAEYFQIMDLYFKKTEQLSGGQKQILNLASIMAMQPRVLVLDEPTSQLDPVATEKFIQSLKKINEDFGITVILSEHRLSYVLDKADKLVVMDGGKIVACGKPREVAGNIASQELEKLMPIPTRISRKCRKDEKESVPLSIKEGREWLLEKAEQDKEIKFCDEKSVEDGKREKCSVCCKNVWFRYEKKERDILQGLNLSVKEGEIFAILGGNGAGKTTMMWLLSGAKKPYRGKISIDKKVALLPQNVQNLFSRDCVEEELEGVDVAFIKQMGLDNLLKQHPYDISGGQQQKLALAKVLKEDPEILLLDEPTKAIDEIYKEELGEILTQLKRNGKTIIMVSHDLDFCGEYADRCGLFANGSLIAVRDSREFFAHNRFYTTTVSKMAGGIIKNAVKMEDVIWYMNS